MCAGVRTCRTILTWPIVCKCCRSLPALGARMQAHKPMEHHHKLVAALTCGTVALTAYHLVTKHNGLQSTWQTPSLGTHVWGIGSLVKVLCSHGHCRKQAAAVTYDWAQSHEEVLIEIAVPATVTAQDIHVKFSASSLLVTVCQQHVIDGQLFGPVDTNNSSWQLGGKGSRRILSVTLWKCPPGDTAQRYTIWDSLLQSKDDIQPAKDQALQQQLNTVHPAAKL
eukprot:GHUV01013451.1.p1 GENE.GHUV01013451.1~~GHUV01013451.1.p1  ORF type:complete len:224 (+),score=36.61 GHUV01013451.1:114-785(+)